MAQVRPFESEAFIFLILSSPDNKLRCASKTFVLLCFAACSTLKANGGAFSLCCNFWMKSLFLSILFWISTSNFAVLSSLLIYLALFGSSSGWEVVLDYVFVTMSLFTLGNSLLVGFFGGIVRFEDLLSSLGGCTLLYYGFSWGLAFYSWTSFGAGFNF